MSDERIREAVAALRKEFFVPGFFEDVDDAFNALYGAEYTPPIFEPGNPFPTNKTHFAAPIGLGKEYYLLALPATGSSLTGLQYYIALTNAFSDAPSANTTIIMLPLYLTFREIIKRRLFKRNDHFFELVKLELKDDRVYKLKVVDSDQTIEQPPNVALMKAINPCDDIHLVEFDLTLSGGAFMGINRRAYIVSRYFLGETLMVHLNERRAQLNERCLPSSMVNESFEITIQFCVKVLVAHALDNYIRDLKSSNALTYLRRTCPLDLDSAPKVYTDPQQMALGHNPYSRAPETGDKGDQKCFFVEKTEQLTSLSKLKKKRSRASLSDVVSVGSICEGSMIIKEKEEGFADIDTDREPPTPDEAERSRVQEFFSLKEQQVWHGLQQKLFDDASIVLLDAKMMNLLQMAMRADIYSLAILILEVMFGIELLEFMWEKTFAQSETVKSALIYENASAQDRQEAAYIFREMLCDSDVRGIIIDILMSENSVITPLFGLLYRMLSPKPEERPHILTVLTELIEIANLQTLVDLTLDDKKTWPWSFGSLMMMSCDFPKIVINYLQPTVRIQSETVFTPGVAHYGLTVR